MAGTIRDHFTETVGDYDTVADHVVMKNDELHGFLLNAVPFSTDRHFSVIDLGCGTGHGMKLILDHFPHVFLTGIDFSARMVEKSRAHLANFSDRLSLVEGDFTTVDFPQKQDAIVSAVSIHNIPHEDKVKLFGKIFAALNPGGVFINADFVEGEVPEINEQYRAIYERFLRANLSGSELDVWLHHAFVQDMPMKLTQQFAALRACGFENCQLLWQFNNQAVYIAIKPLIVPA